MNPKQRRASRRKNQDQGAEQEAAPPRETESSSEGAAPAGPSDQPNRPSRKDYDEDQLVRLIARNELTLGQIAERLGLSHQFVHDIAHGRRRPDLQPKIHHAMRQCLREAWMHGGELATEDGRPPPKHASGRSKPYDENLLVELIAAGRLSYTQIAERVGICRDMVWQIATGRARKDLQARIRDAETYYRLRARRIGWLWADRIVLKQIRVGLADDGTVGLRARQDLLDRFLGRAAKPIEPLPPARDPTPDFADLPDGLKAQIMRYHGLDES